MNMPKTALSLVLLLLVGGFSAFSQREFLTSPEAYLGQPQPGDTPRAFAPAHLVDSGYFILGRIAFSADGKEFYFGRNNSWFNGAYQALCWSRFQDGQWQPAELLVDKGGQPTFSIDGRTLFFSNRGTIQACRRTDTGWTPPKDYLERPYALYNFMPTRSGRCYVGSNGTWGKRGDASSWRFAVLAMDPSDTGIQDLGTPLNSPGFNGDFYIAPDESYMIISAKETKDYESELWISFRQKDQTWTAPRSLGPLINTGAAHRFGQYVSPDGKFLFYTQGTSPKDCGEYWVRFDTLLDGLRRGADGISEHGTP